MSGWFVVSVVSARTDRALENILGLKTAMDFIPVDVDFRFCVQANIERLPDFVTQAYNNDRESCLRYLTSYARKRWQKRLSETAQQRWKKEQAGEEQAGLRRRLIKTPLYQGTKRARIASPIPSNMRAKPDETTAGEIPTLPAAVLSAAEPYRRNCQNDPAGVILGYYDDPMGPLAPGMDIDHFWEYGDCDQEGPVSE
ncbi:hypothetical protein BO86DRAFT_380328 [Aspergillus japonicus CBS 114.51]|uniref:Uncharacterized protein n=1 Tax=Aspergillus japonicus CBS 114.51 TaxID=1448312 RepID=A0A8T8WXT0_ASPJA|nr:hypothetical protein BO86DRAFT_380328 [Aspergillus japonicus CBS 114.51]RAH80643.1 hypothetical protein BO86DRAFT_380328 [Aspergillus japonicus CBS 114.51]